MRVKDITTKLNQVAQAITGRLLIEDLVCQVNKACQEVMGADASSIFLVDGEKEDYLIMKASAGYRHDLSNKAKYRLREIRKGEKLGVTAWIAITGRTFRVNNRREFNKCPQYFGGKYDERLWGKNGGRKCESFCGVPLRAEDRIFGVLKVESNQPNQFSRDHELILQTIASMVTSALQNVTAIRSLHSLFDIIGKHPGDSEKLYNFFAKTCAQLVHTEACSIFVPNEKGRLVMRGDYGHDISYVNDERDEFSYAPGEGVTGTVFQSGISSSVKSKEEVEAHPKHESKLYPKQWKDGIKHICHSWYQFCLGQPPSPLGVMKVENKLGFNGKAIEKGGFNKTEEQILEILANSVIQVVNAGKEREAKEQAVDALYRVGFASNINDIFSPELLSQIEELGNPKNQELHKIVIEFIEEVKARRGKKEINYLSLAEGYIDKMGLILGIDREFLNYCKSLQLFEPILFLLLPNYRAHFIHQLNVFLNGYLIINHDIWGHARFNKIQDIIAERLAVPKSDKKSIDILKIWFITAMFHDTGYPLGKVGNWTENFLKSIFGEKFEDKDIARIVVETIAIRLFRATFRESLDLLISHLLAWIKLTDSQKNEISQRIHDIFFDKLSENLIAALILLKAAENTNMNDHCTLSSAVAAIMLDDEEMWNILMNSKISRSVSYKDHPLAFLLVYSDTIQEYGRYKTDPGQTEKTGRAVAFDPCKVVKQNITFKQNKIHCTLEYQHKPKNWEEVQIILHKINTIWKGPSLIDFIISYKIKDGDNFGILHFLKES